MLKFWTAGDAKLIDKAFGPALKSFRPHVPAHKFIPFKDGEPLPEPEPGDVILACGGKPLEVLRAAGIAPKNRTLTGLRERPFKRGEGHFMLTFDPYVTTTEHKTRELLAWDVRLAHRMLTMGNLEPQVGDYVWVGSYAPMIAEIEAEFAKTGKPVKVAFDTETMGLYPWYEDKDFVCISFTHRRGRSEMIYLGPKTHPVEIEPGVIEQIRWILTSPKVRLRMANGKYDMIWVAEKWGLECTNFKFDTLLVGSLLNENRTNSLNLHAKLFTGFGAYDDAFNGTQDKGAMEKIDPADLRVYQGGDTDAAYQVADVLQDELSADPTLTNFYVTVLHPAARAFEKIERRGILVDQEKFAVLRTDLKRVVKESQKKQLELLPWKLRHKYHDRIDDQIAEGKNPLLPSILQEFFFTPAGLNLKPQLRTPKDNKPSLAMSHLRAVAEGRPEAHAFIEAMSEGDSAAKTLSTFVDGFLRHLRPDGRFHPSYMLFHGGFGDDSDDESGTVTGRLSAKEPAFQTLPKKKAKVGENWAKRLRACYPAPPGKVVVMIDYSQGELKVVACFAPEPTMIKAYLDGLDLHAVTGAKFAGVPLKEFLTWKENDDKALVEKFDRYRGDAKPANFGLLYGQMAPGFQAYAWANYGVKLTLKEAETMRTAFFELYPRLFDFHDRQRMLVNLHGEVRSPLGRLRHLPDIWSTDRETRSKVGRQAINSPIQSTLADMMEYAIALIDAEFPNGEVAVVGNIHDALVAYIDEDKVATLLPQAMAIMSNLPLHKLGWNPPLKFTVDAEVGHDLANMAKFKLAA